MPDRAAQPAALDAKNSPGRRLRAFRDQPQMVRFVLVGIVNTAFGYSVYAALLYVGVDYVLASFGSLVLGILFSFRTQGTWVFGNREWRRLLRYVPSWLGIYMVNVALITVLLRMGLNAYGAGAIALVPIAALSFLIQKLYVFAETRPARTGRP